MLAHARVCGCSELCEMPDDDAICEVQYTQIITHAAPRYVPIHLASESIRRHALQPTFVEPAYDADIGRLINVSRASISP